MKLTGRKFWLNLVGPIRTYFFFFNSSALPNCPQHSNTLNTVVPPPLRGCEIYKPFKYYSCDHIEISCRRIFYIELLPVMSYTKDSAPIYIMVFKIRNTIFHTPPQLSLHSRAALSSNSKGTRSVHSRKNPKSSLYCEISMINSQWLKFSALLKKNAKQVENLNRKSQK
jgi:hypothetical protein